MNLIALPRRATPRAMSMNPARMVQMSRSLMPAWRSSGCRCTMPAMDHERAGRAADRHAADAEQGYEEAGDGGVQAHLRRQPAGDAYVFTVKPTYEDAPFPPPAGGADGRIHEAEGRGTRCQSRGAAL